MRKATIRIFIALILTLALMISSFGAVGAASNGRFMEINLIDAHFDLSGGQINFIPPSASFSYNHIGVYGYEYQWFTQAPEYDAPWEPWGNIVTVQFGNRQPSGTNINLPLPGSFPYIWGGSGKVVVYLLNQRGNYIHGFGPEEPEPAMYWYPTVAALRFNYISYDAAGYKYQWYHDGIPFGDTQYVWFDGIQTSGSNLAIADYRSGQGRSTVEVWLIKTNGHKIPGAYLSAGFTVF